MNNPFESHFSVLLLEDSPEDRMLYKRRLSAIPGVTFDIEEASNVQDAKNKSSSHHFDCYIIDYNLPDATGLDFIRHLLENKNENNDKAAIIIITGKGNEEVAAEAFKLGAHEYLTKRTVSDGVFDRPVLNAIEKAQLIAQLHHFRDKLERSNKDLSKFAHTAAHDLKSPLRRIASYCEILQEDVGDRLNEEEKGMLERMMVNARRMQDLVDNLLSYSMIGYDEEEKEEISLKELAEKAVDEFKEIIENNNAKIDIGALPKARVYPVRMHQLLSNLISNALKYKSDKTPHIVIDAKQQEDSIRISVQDNGQGIPENQREEIFKDFRRLHADEEIEGTGLGLSICRKITERHGGKIWVDTKPGEGSTFYFTLKND